MQAVFANHDDDPYAVARDAHVRGALAELGVALHTSKDHVVFERSEVLTGSGKPYSVFTPYKTAWLKKLEPFYLKPYPVERYADSLAPAPDGVGDGAAVARPARLRQDQPRRAEGPRQQRRGRGAARRLPGAHRRLRDRARLSRRQGSELPERAPALRHDLDPSRRRGGARPCRGAGRRGSDGADVWLSELIWRDFYHQVLHHLPHVVTSSCKPEFDKVRFEHGRHADEAFAAWCEGRTGYPLVDAAMAQINQTGWMHNRLRMVTASFLTKDLGIDWRRGEAYFAEHLIDYDLAANNGGWQWAASTGCDAQPWFRIFNPVTQSRRFDPEGKFIRRYLPQLAGLDDAQIHAPWRSARSSSRPRASSSAATIPRPIVDHAEAREKTLQRYGVVRAAKGA